MQYMSLVLASQMVNLQTQSMGVSSCSILILVHGVVRGCVVESFVVFTAEQENFNVGKFLPLGLIGENFIMNDHYQC